ncbi:MAG: hypothetical protein AMJ78_01910 [Omnitrophica WOR_2 bacterium SM23_29]|nr:MAG: hypothetical protein AMJ78_01910 [Omnitrophica WOR_2 bacterium SM23_29]
MERVFRHIDSKKDDIVSFTKELISIPTVNPPGENYERIVKVLEKRLKSLGFSTRRYSTPPNILKRYKVKGGSPRITLIARWNVGAKKTLHINGHYDVVPVTSNWKTDPFKPVIKDGKLYGRGAEDMKGDIACALFAVEALKSQGMMPKVNIEFSFVPDEETGGETGLGYIINKGIINPDYALGEGYWKDYVSIGNKGVLWLEIEVKGRSCHGSSPHKGINAFEKMIDVAGAIRNLETKISKRKTKYATLDCRDRYATLVIGGEMKGGLKINVVPDKSVFTIDRRILPEENLDKAEEEIRKAITHLKKRDKSLNVNMRIITKDIPVVVDNKIILTAMGRAIKVVFKKRPKFAIQPGGTDLRFFIKRGIPAVGYGPYGGGKFHADDEHVFVDSLPKTTKVFAQFMMNLS